MKKITAFIFCISISLTSIAQVPNYNWHKVYGGTGKNITLDATGNIYVTGEYTGTRDFDPSGVVYNLVNPGTDKGLYIAKFDASGNFLWAKAINPANSWGWVSPTGICVDDSSHVYVTGYTNDSGIDLNTDGGTNNEMTNSSAGPNGYKSFVVKLYTGGNFAWAHGIYCDYGSSAQTTAQVIYDGYYIKVTGLATADYWGTPLDYAPNSGCTIYGMPNGPNADNSGFIVSYNPSSGDGIAYSGGGHSSANWGRSAPRIAIDNLHYWYVLYYSSGLSMTGNLMKRDPGAVTNAWTKNGIFASSYYAYAFYVNINCFEVDDNYNIYFGGSFTGNVGYTIDFPDNNTQFSFGTTSLGNYDCFLAHYDNLGDLVNAIELESPGYNAFRGFTSEHATGNFFVSGQLTDSLDFDGGVGVQKLYNTAPAGGNDEFIAKYDNNLGLLFAKKYSITSSSIGLTENGLKVNDAGELFAACGLTNGPVDIDLNATTANATAPSSNFGLLIKYGACSVAPGQPGTINGSVTVCSGSSQSYSIASVSGATSYSWTLPGGWSGTSTSTSINVTAGTSGGNISVTANNSCGSSSPQIVAVSVSPNVTPSVSINATQTTICTGTNVTFTATPTNGGSTPSYQWKLNGGNVGSNSSSYSNSALANNDMITCVLTSNAACVTLATATSNMIMMVVNPSVTPAVSINATQITICAGTNVTFTATPTNGGSTPSYQWKLNGGNVGTNSSTYSNSALANNDMITCILTSNAACATTSTATSNMIMMVVNPSVTPSVSINATQTTICAGTNVTFTATPTNGGSTPSYQWKLNGGNVGANSTTYSNSLLVNNDMITCVLTSNAACATTSTATSNMIMMIVNPTVTPSVSINATQTSICIGSSVTFTATPIFGGSTPAYQWKLNGGNVGSNSSSYSNSSLANGDVITCVMTSNASCVSPSNATSNGISMTVSTSVTPAVSINANMTTICSGQTVDFAAIPVNGGSSPSYQWKLNGGNVGTNSSIYSNSTLANGDVITCVITSNASCASTPNATSNSISITVNPTVTPVVTVNASQTTFCAGTTISFDATPVNGGSTPSYQWQVNGSNVGTNSSTYSNSTLVNGDVITCVLTSSATCASPGFVNSNSVSVTVNPLPTAAITPSGTVEVCEGDSALLTASAGNPGYIWNTGATTQSIHALFAGNYSVTVTNINNCSAASSTVTVNMNPLPAIPTISNANDVLTSTTASGYQWFLNNNPINGATNQNYTMTQNGNYFVEISDANDCHNSSTVFVVTTVGITEVGNSISVSVFPNPNYGEFTVNLNKAHESHIQISDVTGKILEEKIATSKSVSFNISSVAAGIYFVKVKCENDSQIFKLIVTK